MKEPIGDLTGRPRRELTGIRQEHTGDTLTLALSGDLVADAGPPLLDLLDAWLTGALRHVVIDLAEVEFIDVAGLRVLLCARRRSAENGTTLTLRRALPYVVWLLNVTQTAALLLEDGGRERPASRPEACPARRTPTADDAEKRHRLADEREQRADERDQHADDREFLADERDRLLDDRQRRVQAHQDWEDIRESLADERELELERREDRGPTR